MTDATHFHETWLGMVQPIGLVFSIPVLVDHLERSPEASSVRSGNAQVAANLHGEEVHYLAVPRNARRRAIRGIPPDGVPTASRSGSHPWRRRCASSARRFTACQIATVTRSRTAPRRRPADDSSRFARRTIRRASRRFFLAEESVRPWVLTPGISSTYPTNHLPCFSKTAVNVPAVRRAVDGS